MTVIDAMAMAYTELNEAVRQSAATELTIENCLGQRYVGCAAKARSILIKGTPGNALGAYLDGATLTVEGNVQDSVGDTMNDGRIVVHGSAGDGLGLSARGGEIFVRGDVGYRAGVHMKQYHDKLPVLMVGNRAGSFLGEYLAGGYIIVLGLQTEGCPINNFCAAGMHGGKIFIRGELPQRLPAQVKAAAATAADMAEIAPYLDEYCALFGVERRLVDARPFHVLTPDSNTPYKRLYVQN